MNSKLLTVLILSWVSGHPSVDRFITELPSHWNYDMVADQPYAPTRPSSYIYQIDDPSANYIYSAKVWDKKDHKRSGSDTSTPTQYLKSAYSHSYTSVPLAEVTYTPVIDGTTPWYPSNYEYYAGNVYTTPYEFSGIAGTFVRPNVLYSTYLTYSKPVYVVNNPYNGYTMPPYVYIYENPKQCVFSTQQQPVHEDGDATKIQNNTSTSAPVKIPIKVQKKPIRTNLTEINIDPITEARKAANGRARSTTGAHGIESEIIHKQRPSYYNTYAIMYHKSQSSDQK